jgi:long-chain acyl-CoA synthetase
MLIGDIPARNAGLYPNKVAVIQDNFCITYAQFDKRTNCLANAISVLGSTKGDRIAVLHHNCYQYIEIYFALAKAGMPVVPLNYRYNPSEILHVIRDSGAKIVLFGKEYMSVVDMIKQKIPSVEHFICIDAHLSGMKNYEEIISEASTREPVLSIDEEDIAILGYTGGTTGRPKGVMTTHRNIITSCYNTSLERLLTPNDILLNVHPIFHAGGANSMFAFFFVGATNVILNTSRIDIDVILKAIQDYKINHLLLVPTLILSIIEHPSIESYDFSNLKTIYYGTSPISIELLKKAMRLFKCNFSQTYGMTETFVPITILKPEDHKLDGSPEDDQRMTSAGREVMGVKVKIVDNDGRELERGKIGEVVVKGKNVMKGYWNQPELTKEALKDGWLYTGDMGKLDELRYLYIVDRKKDMIISGGENIYAKEVEDVLSAHPAVAEAILVGVPDDKWGEVGMGLVIKKRGAELSGEELISFCKSRLASYKKPKFIEFVNEFPKSASGKILKNEIRQKYWKGRDRKI